MFWLAVVTSRRSGEYCTKEVTCLCLQPKVLAQQACQSNRQVRERQREKEREHRHKHACRHTWMTGNRQPSKFRALASNPALPPRLHPRLHTHTHTRTCVHIHVARVGRWNGWGSNCCGSNCCLPAAREKIERGYIMIFYLY